MTAIDLSCRLLALASLLQSIEFIQIRRTWVDIWEWKILRQDRYSFPRALLPFFDLCFEPTGFSVLLLIRIFCSLFAMLGLTHARLMGALFFTSWLISIRWRGTFNGGSDSMTAQIGLCLWLAKCFADTPKLAHGFLAVIAVQITASYFIAGAVKLGNPEWRSGRALSQLFKMPGYDSPPEWATRILNSTRSRWIGLAMIGFECAFPLALLDWRLCLAFLALGLVFHVVNYFLLGLNRFVFAWLAGYPVLFSFVALHHY